MRHARLSLPLSRAAPYIPNLEALAGCYLLALGTVTSFAPDRARQFLGAHTSSAAAHVAELALRLLVGASLVLTAPRMWLPAVFTTFGWVLVVSSVVLCLVPWTLHRRFARWSVPLATERMTLLAVGSLVGGLVLLVSLFGGANAVH